MSGHPGFGAHTDPSFKSQPRSTGEVVRRVGVYLRPYKLMAVGTVTFALLSLAAAFTYPKLTQHVIDEVITKKNAASLKQLARLRERLRQLEQQIQSLSKEQP